MSPRLSRPEQTQRNRSLLLAAARRVFLARGYHGASLDQIADEAGFSKGAVYSQFESKADLFLTLLEARIDERAAGNARVVEGLSGDQGVEVLLEHLGGVEQAEPEWGLLVIEFRIHAARDASLNRRYAAAHERILDGLERVIAGLYERSDEPPPLTPPELARLLFALGAGVRLEQVVDPESLPARLFTGLVARLLAPRSGSPAPPLAPPPGPLAESDDDRERTAVA